MYEIKSYLHIISSFIVLVSIFTRSPLSSWQARLASSQDFLTCWSLIHVLEFCSSRSLTSIHPEEHATWLSTGLGGRIRGRGGEIFVIVVFIFFLLMEGNEGAGTKCSSLWYSYF